MHHVVRSAEEIHNASHCWKSFAHATFHWVLAGECLVVNFRQRIRDCSPRFRPCADEHFFARVSAILRDAGRAVLEVFVAKWHCDFEIRASDEFKDFVRVDRQMPNAERRVINVVDGHFAEAFRRDALQNLSAVMEGDMQRISDDRAERSGRRACVLGAAAGGSFRSGSWSTHRA